MERKRPDVDVISDILKLTLDANPGSEFIQSLIHQYAERGGLSKKQLQGLYGKARNVSTIPPNKLATLEAVILKKPTKYKSVIPPAAPLYTKNEQTGKLISEILAKYPAHKRVLFIQARFENNEPLTPSEISELERFHKLLA